MAAKETIHFIGIGGIGMSGLARLVLNEKCVVRGSDVAETPLLAELQSEGIAVMIGQIKENIRDDVDLFVYSEAVPADNPELAAARATGKPVVNYFEALSRFVNPYYLIAVAGTHGKTTTTAMLADIFAAAEKDPTVVVGSLRAKSKSNFRPGKSKYAIVEACEYRRDFLHLTPDILVITNIEHDHVDYYQSLTEVQQSFRDMIGQVHDTGVVIANPKDPNVAPVVAGAPVPVRDYTELLDPQLPLKQPGLHNRLNAAAALAVAKHEQLELDTAKTALSDFAGTWRRFEYKGEVNGAPVYDDYAHHPTEIEMTIAGARELYPAKRLHIVFQPHTYTRTAALFDQFARALATADRVLVAPIYAARETNESGVSSRELAVKTLEYARDVEYLGSLDEIARTVELTVGTNDVVLVLGAGDVTKVAEQLTKR